MFNPLHSLKVTQVRYANDRRVVDRIDGTVNCAFPTGEKLVGWQGLFVKCVAGL